MQAAGHTPDPREVRLIAAYLLCTNLPPERLLDTLYPGRWNEKVRHKVYEYLVLGKGNFRLRANQLAETIRGSNRDSDDGKGRKPADLLSYHHLFEGLVRKGLSVEEATQRLLKDAGFTEEELTSVEEEMQGLKAFGEARGEEFNPRLTEEDVRQIKKDLGYD